MAHEVVFTLERTNRKIIEQLRKHMQLLVDDSKIVIKQVDQKEALSSECVLKKLIDFLNKFLKVNLNVHIWAII